MGPPAMTVEAAALRAIATECVNLAVDEFDRILDWRLESLETVDEVCAHSECMPRSTRIGLSGKLCHRGERLTRCASPL